ncbi:hypothetical protein [Longimicrobium sp.]|uniref:hypothetical protein n=1 Tax=Longimicrobium sp. TaxID=2029185 RepID=UPI002C44B3D5|nr:hypothetical protein [Longimicrobium sp.]HSU17146.1 hypothetical protein [Longimicrobium sp.]
MRADTFAKLVTLETLIDAEVGYWLQHHPASMDRYREALVARVSDLLDEIDRLDEVAAARIYDALVDFLAELPEDDEGVVEAAVRFKRAVDKLIDRAMEPRDLDDASTWAVVLDGMLDELAYEYPRAVRTGGGEADPRACIRARELARAARDAGERMIAARRTDARTMLRDDLDRLVLAVEHRRLSAAEAEPLIRAPQRIARRLRPSGLGRVGAAVVGQLLRRRSKGPKIP